ncbi:unnamed protein product [Parnassius mnemosyne]
MIFPVKFKKITYVFFISISIIVIYFRLHFKNVVDNVITDIEVNKNKSNEVKSQKCLRDVIKYILLWINPKNRQEENVDRSLYSFSRRNCAWNNCYLTVERQLISDFSQYSVILFKGADIEYIQNSLDLPKNRYPNQKYVFVSEDLAAPYTTCGRQWDGFFNWTWTYKLDSDLIWNSFVIRDVNGTIIGPKQNMNWIKLRDMKPIDSKFIMNLRSKTKIAAWFTSNCRTQSLREMFVNELQKYLDEYNLQIDIYGKCGNHRCPKVLMKRCLKMVEREYYFYLAFENTLSEDYVTNIILHALNHNAVPVVLGGANYTRFMPDGAYLNALEYGPEKLARRMFEIMQNLSLYQKFFRWKQHYSYHAHDEAPETDNYCRLCALVNNRKEFNTFSLKKNFTNWWTPKGKCLKD